MKEGERVTERDIERQKERETHREWDRNIGSEREGNDRERECGRKKVRLIETEIVNDGKKESKVMREKERIAEASKKR